MADTSPTPAAPTEDSSNGGSTTTKTAEDVSSPIFLSKDTEIQSKILGDEHDDDEILEVEPEPSSTICNIEEILVGQNENNDDNIFQPTPTSPESINTVIQSPLDPLAESYRVSFFSSCHWRNLKEEVNNKWLSLSLIILLVSYSERELKNYVKHSILLK